MEEDLISFCDHELELLGDIRALNVLYAGGTFPLWIEGLSQRIGGRGRLTALDADRERVEHSRRMLAEAALAAPARLVTGDVFDPPFETGSFDLVYSAGLFHELDVRGRSAEEAIRALISVVQSGGRMATSDFVNSVPALQFEDEELQRELARESAGAELHGIGPPERLVRLHETFLADVRWRVSPPRGVRHLEKSVLAEEEPEGYSRLQARTAKRLRESREALLERVRREGYTRPATLYLEGSVPSGVASP